MAPVRVPAFEGCQRAILGNAKGCQHGCEQIGRCPYLDYDPSQVDRILQLRLRARDLKNSGRGPN